VMALFTAKTTLRNHDISQRSSHFCVYARITWSVQIFLDGFSIARPFLSSVIYAVDKSYSRSLRDVLSSLTGIQEVLRIWIRVVKREDEQKRKKQKRKKKQKCVHEEKKSKRVLK
jgi:hypothetical protein